MPLVLGLIAACLAQRPAPFAIEVVDAATGRGVPLVELRTVNDIRYYTDSNGLAAFDEPGWAAIAWGFQLSPAGGRTLLVTECRTRATDPASRRGFLRYRRLMRPFIAYIVGLSPRLVRERAEAPA